MSANIVECAVLQDGHTSPAGDFIDALSEGIWTDDTDSDGFPDPTQISHGVMLLAWIKRFADLGLPARRTAINDLDDGVWEFKPGGVKRLSFFDTPGDGTYTAKLRGRDGEAVEDDYWWFPVFDDYIRLGHAFPKTGQRTGPKDIELSLRVRTEDLDHDRTS